MKLMAAVIVALALMAGTAEAACWYETVYVPGVGYVNVLCCDDYGRPVCRY